MSHDHLETNRLFLATTAHFFRIQVTSNHIRDRILGTEVTLTYHGTDVASCGKINAVATDDYYTLECPVTWATGVKLTDDVVETSYDNDNYRSYGVIMNIAEVWVFGINVGRFSGTRVIYHEKGHLFKFRSRRSAGNRVFGVSLKQ